VQRGSTFYRSGNWTLAEKTAKALVGGKIHFLHKKATPSFFGGRIVGVEVIKEGTYKGKIIFVFEREQECIGVKTSGEGWSQVMKIVY